MLFFMNEAAKVISFSLISKGFPFLFGLCLTSTGIIPIMSKTLIPQGRPGFSIAMLF